MDSSLCQQLLGAVKENFVSFLHRPHLGYRGSIILDILTDLYATYTVITNADWLAKDKRFFGAYSPPDPSEVVWRNIDDTVVYVYA